MSALDPRTRREPRGAALGWSVLLSCLAVLLTVRPAFAQVWARAALVGAASSSLARSEAHDATAPGLPGPVLTVRRFALVVGANDGGHDRVVLRYANTDAAAMSAVLQSFGAVAAADHERLVDPTPAQLQAAFARMATAIEAAHASGQHVQFVFYYSGHSDEEGLLLAGDRVTYKQLREQVQSVPADVRIAVLDSCASGAFTRTKGGTKRAPFLVSPAAEVKGHAFLTSSSVDEAAQESDRVGGSFFTHYFTTGLRGAADVDGDRLVTLTEAYEFAFDETLARTEATRGGAQHAAYDIQLAGTGDLVMTDLRETSARLELADELGGRISVRHDGGALAAELYKPPGSAAVRLALEPGRYQVTVDDGQILWRSDVTVVKGETATLDRSVLGRVEPEATTTRGGAAPGGAAAPKDEVVTVPFNVALVPDISLNAQQRKATGSATKIRNIGSIAAGWSRAYRVDGIAAGFGATFVDDRMSGVQLAMGANFAGVADGGQVAVGFNHARLASGLQAATVNHAQAMEPGVQLGMVNVGGKLHGAQLGMINVGGDVKGVQLGLFNFSRRADAALGLLSVTREGGVHPEISLSDTAALNLGLRFPATHTYSFVSMGVQPTGSGEGWQVGLGVGGRVRLPAKLFLDFDWGGFAVFRGLGRVRAPDPMSVLRMTFGWQPRERIAVFGGPTLNALVEIGTAERLSRPGLYQWSAVDELDTTDRVHVRVWPGFVAGLRF